MAMGSHQKIIGLPVSSIIIILAHFGQIYKVGQNIEHVFTQKPYSSSIQIASLINCNH